MSGAGVAKFSGADAIHPGYGLLPESPEFAVRCKRQYFHRPESGRQLGSKVAATRNLAIEVVPVVPATDPLPNDAEEVKKLAKAISYAVMQRGMAMQSALALAAHIEGLADPRDIPARLAVWERGERPLDEHCQRWWSLWRRLGLARRRARPCCSQRNGRLMGPLEVTARGKEPADGNDA